MGLYRNPLLPGCHPDPSICRFRERYVLVTSTFEYLPGLTVHTSTNLVDWDLVGHVIHREGQLDLAGIGSSNGLYAPTVRVVDERLMVVCTLVGPDDGSWPGRTGTFLVSADDPAGPWSDPVWIAAADGFDPSITVDGDRVYLCGTRPDESGWVGRTEVWIAELDTRTGALLTDPVVVWTGADARAVWAEGPHILERPGGGWVLVAAEGGTDIEHAVVVAYADEIMGPYTGDAGNPRLTHRDLGAAAPVTAVGHADLVRAPDGGTWATVLATHPVDGRRGLLGRRTSLVPVAWENARPLFAPGSGRVEHAVEARGVPDAAPRASAWRDDFTGPTLDLGWTGVGRMPHVFADLAARAGHVRLFGGDEPASAGAVSFLGRRLPEERAEMTVVVDIGEGDLRAGLLLRVSEQQVLELSLTADGAVALVLTTTSGVRRLGHAVVAPSGPRTLALRIADLRASARVDGRLVAEVGVDELAPRPPRGFVGAWIGPVAVGTGYVDVTAVTLEWQMP